MTEEQGAWFVRVSSRYTETHRHYHDVRHLRTVLALLQHWSCQYGYTAIPSALFFASLYHDAIYDPHRTDNEEQSAELCRREMLGARMAATTMERATSLILSTRLHHPIDNRFDAIALLNADLWILGSAPQDYARYATQIRQEYAHVPVNVFNTKRADILEKMLTRPRLYSGSGLRVEKREMQARINVESEIARLRMSML